MGGTDRLYAADTRCLEDAGVFGRWYDRMPEKRRAKIDACRNGKDRRLSLGAGILLRLGLENAGVKDARIGYGEDGKPFVVGAGGIRFNLSHSGAMAACAVSSVPVGLDVEEVRHFGDDLAAFVFHESEIGAARAAGEFPDQEFTALWTIKESLMKYCGAGLRLTPKMIRVLSRDPVRVEVKGAPREGIRFTEYAFPGYRMTVCSETGPFPEPEWIDLCEEG